MQNSYSQASRFTILIFFNAHEKLCGTSARWGQGIDSCNVGAHLWCKQSLTEGHLVLSILHVAKVDVRWPMQTNGLDWAFILTLAVNLSNGTLLRTDSLTLTELDWFHVPYLIWVQNAHPPCSFQTEWTRSAGYSTSRYKSYKLHWLIAFSLCLNSLVETSLAWLPDFQIPVALPKHLLGFGSLMCAHSTKNHAFLAGACVLREFLQQPGLCFHGAPQTLLTPSTGSKITKCWSNHLPLKAEKWHWYSGSSASNNCKFENPEMSLTMKFESLGITLGHSNFGGYR